jgi:hypothetical protein
MGQDPREIRQDIEQTRERMGDTVEALGHKTDVTGRAKEAISDRMGSVKEKVSGVGSTVSESTPDGGDMKHGARKAAGVAQENPLGLALGALHARGGREARADGRPGEGQGQGDRPGGV